MTRFDGDDYTPERDDPRLTAQQRRIWQVMSDGEWHTLAGIAFITRDPEASVSAQLRHLRKPRFGGHTIDRRHLGNGLYEYRLIPHQEPAMPTCPRCGSTDHGHDRDTCDRTIAQARQDHDLGRFDHQEHQ